MAYTKTTWTDKIVQYPGRYTAVVAGSQYSFTEDPGTIVDAGTPVSAVNMNKMETGIESAHIAVDEAKGLAVAMSIIFGG